MTTMHWVLIALGVILAGGGVAAFFLVPSFRTWVKTQGREALMTGLKTYVVDNAKSVAEREYKLIAARIVSGDLSSVDSVKAELRRLGTELKKEIYADFGGENGLKKILGPTVDAQLDKLIRWGADKISPFPGKSTAEALLESKVSNILVDKGLDAAQSYFAQLATQAVFSANGLDQGQALAATPAAEDSAGGDA